MANIGVGISNILGYEQDTIGIGFTWGDPSNTALREQFATEAYYKMQITPHFALTGDVQAILNPANAPASGSLLIFSLRGRIAF